MKIQSLAFNDNGRLLLLEFADKLVLSVPADNYPRLRNASVQQINNYRLINGGSGIHWPELDEDLSLAGLLHDDNLRTVSQGQ